MTKPRAKPGEDSTWVNVWLVSSGDYSDYTVHCVFLYEADAKEYANEYNNNKNPKWAGLHDMYVERRDMWLVMPFVVKEGEYDRLSGEYVNYSADIVRDRETGEERPLGDTDD